MHYRQGDLLQSPSNLAHCVSHDMVMGRGIAVEIANRFGRHDINIAPKHGVAWKIVDNRYILYLITKDRYDDKPSLLDMKITLINLRWFCETRGIRQLSIPRIGCGLDRLSWTDVEKLIIEELDNHGIEITVYIE